MIDRAHSISQRLQRARLSADLLASPAWRAFIAEFERELCQDWLKASDSEDTRLGALRSAVAAIKGKLARDAASAAQLQAELEKS